MTIWRRHSGCSTSVELIEPGSSLDKLHRASTRERTELSWVTGSTYLVLCRWSTDAKAVPFQHPEMSNVRVRRMDDSVQLVCFNRRPTPILHQHGNQKRHKPRLQTVGMTVAPSAGEIDKFHPPNFNHGTTSPLAETPAFNQ